MSLVRSLLVALSLAVAVAAPVHAKCAYYAESLMTTEVIGPQPTIILRVYAMDETLLASGRFVLVGARGEEVPLVVAAHHDGMNQRQLELVPRTALGPGSYRLRRLDRTGSMGGEDLPLSVRAAAAPVAAPPAEPVFAATGAHRTELGCGPVESIDLRLGADAGAGAGAKLAFVELTAGPDGATQSGFVAIVDGLLAVGHGMCAGEFQLTEGARYHAVISLVGADGQRSRPAHLDLTYAP